MSHLALYRKYRSQSFQDLVGQDHVVRTLSQAIEQGKIAHAYLFTGPRGTGKTSTARLLAKALNCTDGPRVDPPEDDPICQDIAAGTCLDVLEMDAAGESGADDVRERIVEASQYQPAYCRYRVFIIDEVHDLSAKAFDVLLKTIEEPPAHVIFILATTEYNKVPPTIRSRCQKFEFHRGTLADLYRRLTEVCEREGFEADPAALNAIARMADGGYRDALTLLEQAALTADGKITLEHVYDQLGLVSDEQIDIMIRAIVKHDFAGIIKETEEIYRRGRDPRAILESLLYRLADLTRAVYRIESSSTTDAAAEAGLSAAAADIGAEKLLSLRGFCAEAHRTIQSVSLPRVWLEAELVRISQVMAGPPAVAPIQAVAAVKPQPPRPAPGKAETVAVAPKEAPKPTAPAKPATPSAADHADDPTWRSVVQAVSAVSKTAAIRLPDSRIGKREGNLIVIEFKQKSAAEWVKSKLPLIKELTAQWKAVSGEEVTLDFVGLGADLGAPKMEPTSVESPLEGERLVEVATDVFTSHPNTP